MDTAFVFPHNLDALKDMCEEMGRRKREIYDATQLQIRQAQEQSNDMDGIAECLYGFQNSWQELDPGKNYVSSWILDEHGERSVMRELLQPNSGIYSKEKWEERKKDPCFGTQRFAWVPPHYPVISVADAQKAACPTCKKESLLIVKYWQSYDSDMGDTWSERRIVICCGKAHVLKITDRKHRF